MQQQIFPPKRLKNGGLVVSRLYRGRYRLAGDAKPTEVSLATEDKAEARRKLADLVSYHTRLTVLLYCCIWLVAMTSCDTTSSSLGHPLTPEIAMNCLNKLENERKSRRIADYSPLSTDAPVSKRFRRRLSKLSEYLQEVKNRLPNSVSIPPGDYLLQLMAPPANIEVKQFVSNNSVQFRLYGNTIPAPIVGTIDSLLTVQFAFDGDGWLINDLVYPSGQHFLYDEPDFRSGPPFRE